MDATKRFSERRVMVAIGNTYQDSGYPESAPLSTPGKSAPLMAALLRDWGEFEGDAHLNLGLERMTSLLESAFGGSSGQGAPDTAVFFFSGYAVAEAGLSLLADDGQRLPVGRLLDIVEASEAKNVVLILDCNHAGGVILEAAQRQGNLIRKKSNVAILASCRPEENCVEEAGAQASFFAEDLLRAAYHAKPDADGFVTMAQWWEAFWQEWRWTRECDPVAKAAVSQEPQFMFAGSGLVIFHQDPSRWADGPPPRRRGNNRKGEIR